VIEVEGTDPELVMAVANALPPISIDQIQQLQSARFTRTRENLNEQIILVNQQIIDTQAKIDQLAAPQTIGDDLRLSQLESTLLQHRNSYVAFQESYEALRLAEAQSVDSVLVVAPAVLPNSPIYPNPILNIGLALSLGLFLGIIIVLLLEYLDDRLQSSEQLGLLTGAPMLAEIDWIEDGSKIDSQKDSLIALEQPRHPISEKFRTLRTNLQFSNIDIGFRSILVTSAIPGEGKSTIAANLACVMAQAGRQVVLIDADLRRSTQFRNFLLRPSPGLAEALLAEKVSPELFLQAGPIPNLQILTSGQSVPNPAELLASERMKNLIDRIGEQADIIIIDSPPIVPVTDAQVLGRLVQGALLVASLQVTPRHLVAQAASSLAQVNIPLLGTVLNHQSRQSSNRTEKYSYYGYNDRIINNSK
jgi:non-specific protein-tyrosine kinase